MKCRSFWKSESGIPWAFYSSSSSAFLLKPSSNSRRCHSHFSPNEWCPTQEICSDFVVIPYFPSGVRHSNPSQPLLFGAQLFIYGGKAPASDFSVISHHPHSLSQQDILSTLPQDPGPNFLFHQWFFQAPESCREGTAV